MDKSRLPEYQSPPLHEVALSVQFEHLANFDIVQLGKTHALYEDNFPGVEMHPPLEPQIERFGTKRVFPQHSLRLLTGVEFPRVWFLNKEKTELVQIQKDRFAKNWRKLEGAEVYPRYEYHIKPNFERDYQILQSFLSQNDLGTLNPLQCEVTYVNHITPPSSLSSDCNALAAPFSFFGNRFEEYFLNKIEGFTFKTSQVLRFGQASKARLIVQIDTGTNEEDEHVLKMALTVRGAPEGKSLEEVLSFMDFGRGAIINSFDRITTAEMHKIWIRRGD